jgi:hypothetical protein
MDMAADNDAGNDNNDGSLKGSSVFGAAVNLSKVKALNRIIACMFGCMNYVDTCVIK